MAAGIEAAPSAPASGGDPRARPRSRSSRATTSPTSSATSSARSIPTTNEILPGDAGRASDLSVHLRLTPTPYLAFEGKTDYSVTGGRPRARRSGCF